MEPHVGPRAGRLHGFHAHAEFRLRLLGQALLEIVASALVGPERLRELAPDLGRVEIPHHRQDHLIRNVAVVVEGLERGERRVLDHVLQADGVPLVRMVAEHEPLDLVVDLVVGPVLTLVVFRHHDLPLLVHLLLSQPQVHPGVDGAVERLVEILLRRGESEAGVVVGGVAAGLLPDPLHLLAEFQLALLERAAPEDEVLVVVAQTRERRGLGAAPAVHEDARGHQGLGVVLDQDEAEPVGEGLAADRFGGGAAGYHEPRSQGETEDRDEHGPETHEPP
jgi:hypothetical protein